MVLPVFALLSDYSLFHKQPVLHHSEYQICASRSAEQILKGSETKDWQLESYHGLTTLCWVQTTMNLLLLGATSLPVGYMAFGFISLLVPPK